MKKLLSFSIFLLGICSCIFAAPLQDRQIAASALDELFSALGISKEAAAQTLSQWVRKPGQERWEVQELSEEKRLAVLRWAEEQGFFAPWKPSQNIYDKAFVLGCTTTCMHKRLGYLIKLWEEGVRFEEIVWLTGDRPLDARVDELTEFCRTESDAAKWIWETATLPKEMRALSVQFIAVPMKSVEGVSKRPNTEDTIIAWLDTFPKPCSCLFVSDQPFCGYQFAVIKAALPDTFPFDVVGEGTGPQGHHATAAIILDSIARSIY